MENSLDKLQTDNNERFAMKLPLLEGNRQIYLGQMFVTMLRLDRSLSYTDQQKKQFDVELIASVIEELGIDVDDIAWELKLRKDN